MERPLRYIPIPKPAPVCKHQYIVKRIKDPKLIREICEANKVHHWTRNHIDIRRCNKCGRYKQVGE